MLDLDIDKKFFIFFKGYGYLKSFDINFIRPYSLRLCDSKDFAFNFRSFKVACKFLNFLKLLDKNMYFKAKIV